jgi:hypothetical protein
VFAVATAVIVLHIVVVSFIAPQPAAARADHLPGGLVSIAVAALAIALYPRLRAGARASIALVFGALALVGGSLALLDTVDGGPGRDDWTGLLLLPAGLALVVLGLWLLWSSRKAGRYRYLRRAVVALATLCAVYWVVFPAAFGIVATQNPRASVEAADLGRPYEEVTLRTIDGLMLAGWYVPSQNGAAVIAFPERSGPVEHARMLVRHGYGVLLLDMRGQGESEGDPNAFGWESAKDLDAAIAFLQARPDVDEGRIGGLGLSVGGEQLLETAAGNLGLRAVVSEGAGWRSVRESFARHGVSDLQVWLQAPQDAVLTAATAVLSGDSPPPSLEELVAQIAPRPVLLIYGEHDNGGEQALTPAYYEAAGEPKQLWEVPGAAHTGGIDARPGEYEQRVIAFLDAALLGS